MFAYPCVIQSFLCYSARPATLIPPYFEPTVPWSGRSSCTSSFAFSLSLLGTSMGTLICGCSISSFSFGTLGLSWFSATAASNAGFWSKQKKLGWLNKSALFRQLKTKQHTRQGIGGNTWNEMNLREHFGWGKVTFLQQRFLNLNPLLRVVFTLWGGVGRSTPPTEQSAIWGG